MAVRHGSMLTLADSEKNVQAFETKNLRKLCCTIPTFECGIRSTTFCAHRNFFLHVPWDRNWHVLGMLHAMTASLKPAFMAAWRVGDASVDRRWMLDGPHHRVESMRNVSAHAETAGMASHLKFLKRISAEWSHTMPKDPAGRETELNCFVQHLTRVGYISSQLFNWRNNWIGDRKHKVELYSNWSNKFPPPSPNQTSGYLAFWAFCFCASSDNSYKH